MQKIEKQEEENGKFHTKAKQETDFYEIIQTQNKSKSNDYLIEFKSHEKEQKGTVKSLEFSLDI